MTTEAPTLVVTPEEARAQADKLEAGAAEANALIEQVRAARDDSRNGSSEFSSEYDPRDEFKGIQSPAQQSGVALMAYLARRRDGYTARAAGIRKAIADLEAMDIENADDIDKVDTDLDASKSPETPTTTTGVRPV
ncbi:hypothetical protein [Mycobacteroides abscessus]|uniref:hypothetical protein n=1 Tax=Mycobacteroides abscessus TaxID=36809 RepID=UPI000927A5D8|nr:hypothetical protein [Mycobacteroides abscessus]SIF35087.1 Uncharacterised protein [Mycobacteroides abscessus subsp. abscessus]